MELLKKESQLLRWYDVYATLGAARELHGTVSECEEGVVLTAADVLTRMDTGAALTHEDAARGHGLACETLDAQTLCV